MCSQPEGGPDLTVCMEPNATFIEMIDYEVMYIINKAQEGGTELCGAFKDTVENVNILWIVRNLHES